MKESPSSKAAPAVSNNLRYLHQVRQLSHHRLRVWHQARELVRFVIRHPIGDAELRKQAGNAAKSVGCNIAEGAGLDGAAKKRHFRIARGSTIEVVAAYELATDCGEPVPVDEVTVMGAAIASMLTGLICR